MGTRSARGRGQRERRRRRRGAGAGQRGRGRRAAPGRRRRAAGGPDARSPGRARPAFDAPIAAGVRRGAGAHLSGRARRRHRRAGRRLRPGPRRPATGWRGSPPTAWRPSTWGRAPGSGSATSSRPAPWSSWPAAPTAPARCGRAPAPPPSTTSTSHAFEARLDRRLAWAQRRVELPAGRYEVLLPPDATADLMVAMSQAMSGRDAEEGRSPFSAPGGGTRVGEPLCPLPFELRGDPAEPGLEVGAVPRHRGVGDRRVGVRQRPRASAPPAGSRRAGCGACSTTVPPRRARASSPRRRSATWSWRCPAPPPRSTT